MEKVLEFLTENYIWVAAISGFIIIVLIGIIVSTNKKGKKKKNKKEPDVVSVTEEVQIEAPEEIGESINQMVEESPVVEEDMQFQNTNMDSEEDKQEEYNPYSTETFGEYDSQPVYNVDLEEEPVNMFSNLESTYDNSIESPVSIPVEEPSVYTVDSAFNQVEDLPNMENIYSVEENNSYEYNHYNEPVEEPTFEQGETKLEEPVIINEEIPTVEESNDFEYKPYDEPIEEPMFEQSETKDEEEEDIEILDF